MSNGPLVSVVIPCFNHEAYIEESIRSVFSQTYAAIEVLVVNDGSTDNSLSVIRGLQGEYDFRLIDQANQGLTRSVNNGFLSSSGEFFVPFDADDVMLPDRIAVQVDYLVGRPSVGGCGANFKYIDESGFDVSGAPFKKAGSYKFLDFFCEEGVWLGAPTSMYRRQAILDAGGYDLGNKIQDQPMELQVTHAGYCLDIIEDVVTLYRRHGNNMSLNVKGNYPFYLRALERYRDDPGFMAAKRGLISASLKWAVVHDKEFARYLFAQIPLYAWNMKMLKRFRQYFYK